MPCDPTVPLNWNGMDDDTCAIEEQVSDMFVEVERRQGAQAQQLAGMVDRLLALEDSAAQQRLHIIDLKVQLTSLTADVCKHSARIKVVSTYSGTTMF